MVISRGKIKDTFKFERPKDDNTIILDEAHYYRNDLTLDYSDLHKLCAKNKVILLSATPFNNTPKDTFNLIKLFQIPTKSTIQTVNNLSETLSGHRSDPEELEDRIISLNNYNPTNIEDYLVDVTNNDYRPINNNSIVNAGKNV